MTEKRFVDNGIEDIENQSFTDNLTEKTYWIDNGLDEIVDMLNKLNDENIELHIQNDFLKDENQHMRDLVNENEQLRLKNELLEQDLYYCAHQFKEDVKNILLDLKGGLND